MKKNEKFVSFTNALKFVSGIISWVVLVILVIIAIFLVYYFFATKIYGEKGENYKPAFSLYTILSASMEPNIKVYDVIVDVNVKKPEDIKVGDVITFISTSNLTSNMTITHRVIEVVKDGDNYSYKTQGDANLIPDNTNAEYQKVLGKVLFKIPQLGRIQEFLGQKGGWLVVIVIPALGVIISDILKIFRLSGAKTNLDKFNQEEEEAKEAEQKTKQEIENNLVFHYSTKGKVLNEPEEDEKEIDELIKSLDEKQKQNEVTNNESRLVAIEESQDEKQSQEEPKKIEKENIPFELPKLATKDDEENK